MEYVPALSCTLSIILQRIMTLETKMSDSEDAVVLKLEIEVQQKASKQLQTRRRKKE
jgi:hypothetical protein